MSNDKCYLIFAYVSPQCDVNELLFCINVIFSLKKVPLDKDSCVESIAGNLNTIWLKNSKNHD